MTIKSNLHFRINEKNITIKQPSSLRYLLRYFSANVSAWFYSLFILAALVVSICCSYLINQWIGNFFNVLQAYQQHAFYQSMLYIGIVSVVVLVASIVLNYCCGKMRISMIDFYTQEFHRHILADDRMLARLKFVSVEGSQVQEDAPIMASNLNSFTFMFMKIPKLLETIVNIAMYGSIFYGLAPYASNSLFGIGAMVHKPLFFAVLAYCAVVVGVVYLVLRIHHRRQLNYKTAKINWKDVTQQHVTNGRYLANAKVGSAVVAEQKTFFEALKQSLYSLLGTFVGQDSLILFSTLVISLLPWIATGYLYFNHLISLAIMMQMSIAISKFIGSTMELLSKGKLITNLQADLRILADFDAKCRFCSDQKLTKNQPIFSDFNHVVRNHIGTKLSFKHPILTHNKKMELKEVKHLTGPVGIGKSFMLKQLLGLAPCRNGMELHLPSTTVVEFMLQKERAPLAFYLNPIKEAQEKLNAMRHKIPITVQKILDKKSFAVKQDNISEGSWKWLAFLRLFASLTKLTKRDTFFLVMDEPHANTAASINANGADDAQGINFIKEILTSDKIKAKCIGGFVTTHEASASHDASHSSLMMKPFKICN